ncbi:HAD-IC family P-type ATPase [Methanomassiliicoccales archaeon LGM-RCC1]|nr:HAD-IC family P-type ATPase [Methanomassiliicoccales archaeon LGM-RCC1]
MEGLTSKEVDERIKNGQMNNADIKTSRSYTDIIVKNIVTPFNIILFIVGAALIVLENYTSAISATGIITVNIIISTIQEIRAKRRLDKISLLTRPKVTVIRNGGEVVIDQKDIVKDDLIKIAAGEQALVDGELIYCRSMEMDESLLTGESSTVKKNVGDTIYSGSVCVTGEAKYVVTAFGNESYASQMLNSAKKFTSKKTPLQMETGTITTVLMVVAFFLLFLSIIFEVIHGLNIFDIEDFESILEILVLCLDIVPIALFLLITLTYMIAAIRMADTGVLLQRFNSVESLSHVEVVCMDKTGTITTNNLLYESATNFVDDSEMEHMVRLFSNATGSKNRTIRTLIDKFGETETELIEEIQFSSARKYSAVKVRDEGIIYTLYSGAWNVLRPHCSDADKIDSIIQEESSKGFRTLVLCRSEDLPLNKGDDYVINPLTPVSVITIRDEVRPDCRESIDVFIQNGMDIKVISGDDPVTVDALFKIADIPGERNIISGPELEALPDSELDEVVLRTNIFGRMKPENKEKVIEVLKRNSKYVAMIGDGVNDVKPIKSAQVGIALESGSGAARGVADMILVDDNFSALPKALVEGRRTISGIRDILKVYISRNFALAIMFALVFFVFGRMPMLPIQNMFYAFVAVTVIAFFMTVFATPDKNDELILPGVLRFAIPSAIIIGVMGVIIYALTWNMMYDNPDLMDFSYLQEYADRLGISLSQFVNYFLVSMDYEYPSASAVADIVARSSMVEFAAIVGALQLLIVCPRFKFLSVDGNVNKKILPIFLVVFVLGLVCIMFAFFPWFAAVIGMARLPSDCAMLVVAAVAIAFFLILICVKRNIMHRPVEMFEKWYLNRLDKEYTKGDVVNETNLSEKIKDDMSRL